MDGRRWVYSGSGDKNVEANYIEQGDVTPVWSVIADKPPFRVCAGGCVEDHEPVQEASAHRGLA